MNDETGDISDWERHFDNCLHYDWDDEGPTDPEDVGKERGE